MKSIVKHVVCVLFSLCILLGAAEGLPTDKTGMLSHTKAFYVNDYADVLSGEEESILLEAASQLHAAADGAQLVLVTVPRPISDNPRAYAEQLLTLWDVGRAGRQNGMLILVSIDPVEITVVSGSALSPALEEFKQSGFINNAVRPVLEQGEINSGLWLLYQTLYVRVCAAYDLDASSVSGGVLTATPPVAQSHAVLWAGLGCIVLFSGLVGFLLLRKPKKTTEDADDPLL